MAEAGDAESGGEIEETVAIGVPDVRPLRALPEDGPARGEVGDVARLVKAERAASARDLGPGMAGEELGSMGENSSRPAIGRAGTDELRVELVVGAVQRQQSRGVPRSMISPWRRTRMRSAWRMVLSRWAMTKLVRPRSSTASEAWMRDSVMASMELVASSRMRMRGIGEQRPGEADELALARARGRSRLRPPGSASRRAWPRTCPGNRACARSRCTSASVASGREKRMFSSTVPSKRKLPAGPRRGAGAGWAWDLQDVAAVDQERAGGGQIGLGDEVRDRGLSAAGVADERDGLPGLGVEGDVAQDEAVRVVAEADVAEFHVAAQIARAGGRVGGIGPIGRRVEQPEDAFRADQRGEGLGVLGADDADGIEEHVRPEEELDDAEASEVVVMEHAPAAEQEQEADEELAVEFQQRQEDGGGARGAHVVAGMVLREVAEQPGVRLLAHETLGDADAVTDSARVAVTREKLSWASRWAEASWRLKWRLSAQMIGAMASMTQKSTASAQNMSRPRRSSGRRRRC